MSMACCSKGGEFVDTDYDCEFYDFDYIKPGGLCEDCRDDLYEGMTERQRDEHEKRIYG